MIALDTNALVRLAVNDETSQRDAVLQLLRSERTLILHTVLLETEWVLRARYGYTASNTVEFFEWLRDQPDVEFQDSDVVIRTLKAFQQGLDFADALHAATAKAIPLATLDARFSRRAAKAGLQVQLIKS